MRSSLQYFDIVVLAPRVSRVFVAVPTGVTGVSRNRRREKRMARQTVTFEYHPGIAFMNFEAAGR